jgi:uncharacterized FlgJ-related protein
MILKVNDDLSLSKSRSYKKLLIASLSLNVILLFTSMLDLSTEIISVVKDTVTIEKTVEDMKLTDSGLTAELVKYGCVLPAVAVAQAKIESSIGKSNVGVQAKNMFGLTYHKCKYVDGKHGVYAKYKTYRDNVRCYIDIQNKYLRKIDGVYASSPSYIKDLKSLK